MWTRFGSRRSPESPVVSRRYSSGEHWWCWWSLEVVDLRRVNLPLDLAKQLLHSAIKMNILSAVRKKQHNGQTCSDLWKKDYYFFFVDLGLVMFCTSMYHPEHWQLTFLDYVVRPSSGKAPKDVGLACFKSSSESGIRGHELAHAPLALDELQHKQLSVVI